MTVADAQRDMRVAYFSGAPGMLASATVWFVAGLVALFDSSKSAVWTLLVGGVLIHPLAVLVLKAIGRSAQHVPTNPFGRLALESTIWMVLCLPLTYTVSLFRMEWFFPAMLLVIGGRYLTFCSIFGLRTYWLCAGALALAGYTLARADASAMVGAFSGAAIEAVFALIIIGRARAEGAA